MAKSSFIPLDDARREELETEFQRAYRQPGPRHMAIALSIAAFAYAFFYISDMLAVGLVGGGQLPRLAFFTVFTGSALFFQLSRSYIRSHYALAGNVVVGFAMFAAVYTIVAARANSPTAELYWSMTSSVCSTTVVIFGFVRLRAFNTLLLTAGGAVLGVSYVLLQPINIPFSIRMVLHMTIVIGASFGLRRTIERRERELFVMANENLRRNLYAVELEKAVARAEDADAAKSRFLANMSHEVRTPMHGLLQILELVSQSASPAHRVLIDKGRSSGQALLRILNSILDYTKLSHSAVELAPAVVSISETCRTVLDLHTPLLTTKNLDIKLRLDLVPLDDCVLVDEVKLFEIINNLVSNAIKFTSEGYVGLQVRVLARPGCPLPGAQLEIKVSDTGVGLSEQDKAKAFDAFYQVDSTPSRKAGGTGLGLAIVDELVRLLGGSIDVDSGIGVGTTMTVHIPVTMPEATVLALTPSSDQAKPRRTAEVISFPRLEPPQGPLLSGRVLLVEDNDFNSMIAAHMLGLLGLEVTAAMNGLEGFQEFCKSRFDLVLMDCQMPIMDGYESTRQIRAYELRVGFGTVPIVAFTANTLRGDRERCIEAGMSDYVAKGSADDQLSNVVQKWLGGALPRRINDPQANSQPYETT